MASKQYNPLRAGVGFAFGPSCIKPSNEVPTWRCTPGVLGATGFGTAYKTGLKFWNYFLLFFRYSCSLDDRDAQLRKVC